MVNRNKASIHLRFKILSLYILGVNAATNVILSKLGLMNSVFNTKIKPQGV